MECSFCGKEVKPTIHRREGKPPYEVGYYIMLTGTLHERVLKSADDDSDYFQYYHVTDPQWILTCADCFQKEEVRDKLHEYFTYLPEDSEPESDPETETG